MASVVEERQKRNLKQQAYGHLHNQIINGGETKQVEPCVGSVNPLSLSVSLIRRPLLFLGEFPLFVPIFALSIIVSKIESDKESLIRGRSKLFMLCHRVSNSLSPSKEQLVNASECELGVGAYCHLTLFVCVLSLFYTIFYLAFHYGTCTNVVKMPPAVISLPSYVGWLFIRVSFRFVQFLVLLMNISNLTSLLQLEYKINVGLDADIALKYYKLQ